MKLSLGVFLALLIKATFSFGQGEIVKEVTNGDTIIMKKPALPTGQIFTYIEHMPQPTVDIAKFLKEHLKYPEKAKAANIEGRVTVRFIIDKAGDVKDVHIAKGIDASLDSESVRVVRLLPKWKPGMQDNNPVDVYYTLPVNFRLDDDVFMELMHPRNGQRYIHVNKIPVSNYDLDTFFSKNMQYPLAEQLNGVGGTVTIKVGLNEDGALTEAGIATSVYPSLDLEALRLVSLIHKWKPAMADNKPVAVYTTVRVHFEPTVSHPTDQKGNVDSSLPKPYPFPTQMPEAAYSVSQYLQQHLKYPQEAMDAGREGKVIVKFTVSREGKITFVHTPDPINILLDQEARRVVESMPPWKPGKLKDTPIAVYYTLPISFRIRN